MLRACRGQLLGFGAAIIVVIGCRTSPEGEFPGASSAARGGSAKAPTEPKPLGPWTQFDTVRTWPPMTAEPIESNGHLGGRYDVLVRVSPESRQAYRELVRGARLPDGTTVAKFHFERESGAPGPVYAMHKGGGAWDFLVASPDGQLQQRGDLDLCRRCHAEAVADSLFGPPGRFPPPRPPATDGGDPSRE